MTETDILVVHEHLEWQKPLFDALDKRGTDYAAFNVISSSFDPGNLPKAKVIFNQASPSAYTRGHERAVPFTRALLQAYEAAGVRVLNGANVFDFELSKTAQVSFLKRLGIDTPHSITFNDVDALRERSDLTFPCLLKPEQGGSGARMYQIDSIDELAGLLKANPHFWEPSKVFLLQEFCKSDPEFGIVRMEFVGGEMIYAMRVISHGRFNLCPSEVCNPVDGEGEACAIPEADEAPPVEFHAYHEVPPEAVAAGRRIVREASMDVAGIEYLETPDGRRVFYDINANSNLRAPIGLEFGFDPFERVVDFLEATLKSVS